MSSHVIDRPLSAKFIGKSEVVERLRSQINRAASYDVSILLQGESGVGKEVVSRSVHELSGRRGGPYIGVNCAAIHESLLESELFGHEAGAFTGALTGTLGFFRSADGGTILLDEVGDMSQALQRKLLRVLEEKTVIPVGGTRAIPIDVRVIAASHRDLSQAVREGDFRLDLYYRLNVFCMEIPPLRERRSDIPLLVDYLLEQTARGLEMPLKKVSRGAMMVMTEYDWPGNVRQLLNVIKRACVLCDGAMIELEHLPEELSGRAASVEKYRQYPKLEDSIRMQVEQVLEMTGGAKGETAEILGIGRSTLWRILKRHNIG